MSELSATVVPPAMPLRHFVICRTSIAQPAMCRSKGRGWNCAAFMRNPGMRRPSHSMLMSREVV